MDAQVGLRLCYSQNRRKDFFASRPIYSNSVNLKNPWKLMIHMQCTLNQGIYRENPYSERGITLLENEFILWQLKMSISVKFNN